jgi:uncharacterized protein
VTPPPEETLEALSSLVRSYGSAVVAYSGGVDSALVAAIAARELGDRALACIGASPSYPERELRDAIDLAAKLGIRHRIIRTAEHLDPEYVANDRDRCYFCKRDLFEKLRAVKDADGLAVILDGANASDLDDHRPGLAAAAERAVRSPLAEAGIDKAQVRAIARQLGLPVWDKPAMACLASRVPHGTPIRPEMLARIERAESVLDSLGFTQCRVRHHGDIARIELLPDDLARALDMRERIVEAIRSIGYRFVTLDLAGFRSGSLSDPARTKGDEPRGETR